MAQEGHPKPMKAPARKAMMSLAKLMNESEVKEERVMVNARIPKSLHREVRALLKKNKHSVCKLIEVSWRAYLAENNKGDE